MRIRFGFDIELSSAAAVLISAGCGFIIGAYLEYYELNRSKKTNG